MYTQPTILWLVLAYINVHKTAILAYKRRQKRTCKEKTLTIYMHQKRFCSGNLSLFKQVEHQWHLWEVLFSLIQTSIIHCIVGCLWNICHMCMSMGECAKGVYYITPTGTSFNSTKDTFPLTRQYHMPLWQTNEFNDIQQHNESCIIYAMPCLI